MGLTGVGDGTTSFRLALAGPKRMPGTETNFQHAGYQHQPLSQLKFPLRAGNSVPHRLEVNMTSRITKVALAVAVFFLMTSASFAQAPWWGQRDRDDRWGNWGYQNGRDNAYERGVRDGREDRARNRNWHPRNQGQAYLNGYRAGYGRIGGGWQGRRNDNDRDDDYRGTYRGPYGPYGGNNPYGGYGGYGGNDVQSLAYNSGYQHGLGYGQADRNNGHSYRPTYSSTYQNGTNGYNSSMGSQTAYKNAFRQGYQAGYNSGYYGGGGRRY